MDTPKPPCQPLAYHLRLPDAAQPMAFRLLSLAQTHINAALTALWPHLDEFTGSREGPAWKQIEPLHAWPADFSSRLRRCCAEQVGRILRAQATRKQLFALIAPLLHAGMLRQPDAQHPKPDKNRHQIRQDLHALQAATEDGGNYLALFNLIEQACNYYVQHDEFPKTYEQMQEVPVLKTAQLTYAADDGREDGKAYRLRYDLDQGTARLWLCTPEEDSTWDRHWRDDRYATLLHLPPVVVLRLRAGDCLAPTLRVVEPADGLPYVVLDLFVDTPRWHRWTGRRCTACSASIGGCAPWSRPPCCSQGRTTSRISRSAVRSSWTPAAWMAGKPATGSKPTTSNSISRT